MAKIVLLFLFATVVCAYAYPTNENEETKDSIQSEVVRVERAASPVASADPDPYRGGGHWNHGYKNHGYHHYPQYHNHYPKRGGCHRCGHRG